MSTATPFKITPHPPQDCDDCGFLHGAWSAHQRWVDELPAAELSLLRISRSLDSLAREVRQTSVFADGDGALAQRARLARVVDLLSQATEEVVGL